MGREEGELLSIYQHWDIYIYYGDEKKKERARGFVRKEGDREKTNVFCV